MLNWHILGTYFSFLHTGFPLVINNGILIQFGESPTIPGFGGAQVVFPTSFTDPHYTLLGGTTLQTFPQQDPQAFAIFDRTVSGCNLDWKNVSCVAATFFICIGY